MSGTIVTRIVSSICLAYFMMMMVMMMMRRRRRRRRVLTRTVMIR